MRHPSLLAVPAACALALGGLGCGGDEPLSRAEYVKQADAICKDYAARQDKIGGPKTVKDIERLAGQAKPLIKEQLGKLRDLKAPDSVASDADAAYDLLDRQLEKIDELVTAAKANDVAKIQAIAEDASKLDGQANAKAKAIGLKECGQT